MSEKELEVAKETMNVLTELDKAFAKLQQELLMLSAVLKGDHQ